MLILPTRTDEARYNFSVELDGVVYVLNFDFNDRDGAWYLSLSTEDLAQAVNGLALRLGAPVLGKRVRSWLPPGDFILWDTANTDIDPGLSDLGDRVKLVYFTAEEIASL